VGDQVGEALIGHALRIGMIVPVEDVAVPIHHLQDGHGVQFAVAGALLLLRDAPARHHAAVGEDTEGVGVV
jgi:hypothetical protein